MYRTRFRAAPVWRATLRQDTAHTTPPSPVQQAIGSGWPDQRCKRQAAGHVDRVRCPHRLRTSPAHGFAKRRQLPRRRANPRHSAGTFVRVPVHRSRLVGPLCRGRASCRRPRPMPTRPLLWAPLQGAARARRGSPERSDKRRKNPAICSIVFCATEISRPVPCSAQTRIGLERHATPRGSQSLPPPNCAKNVRFPANVNAKLGNSFQT